MFTTFITSRDKTQMVLSRNNSTSFDNNLTFRDHISEKINKAYSVLGIIKRNFIYMDERIYITL